jgi:glucan phosphorylase
MPELGRSVDDIVSELQEAVCRHGRYSQGKEWPKLPRYDRFVAVALAVRDRMVDGMLATEERYQQQDAKRLYYLSIEFLMGRSLGDNLRNLGIGTVAIYVRGERLTACCQPVLVSESQHSVLSSGTCPREHRGNHECEELP